MTAVLAPSSNLSPGGIVANLLFLNAWLPVNDDPVVPGGWSISTEVAFYCLLPIAISLVTTLRRAIATFALTLAASNLLLRIAMLWPVSTWSTSQQADFHVYSPLPHLATFSLGMVWYYLLPALRMTVPVHQHRRLAFALAILGTGLLPLLNAGDLPTLIPRPISAGVPAMLFGLGLALGLPSSGALVVRVFRGLGVLSYGIYLIHFGVLDVVEQLRIAVLPIDTPGSLSFATTLVVTTTFSAIGAFVLHHLVERPALRLGRREPSHHSGQPFRKPSRNHGNRTLPRPRPPRIPAAEEAR